MYLLLGILVGLVVGWLAGKSLEGNGYGRSMDLVMGAGGAVAGGLVIQASGFSGYGGTAFATFVAICCAALLTIVAALALTESPVLRNASGDHPKRRRRRL
jgi:uncharacterized membrane protein YeaQ/YmgE (transglycosylase-associated protein family)